MRGKLQHRERSFGRAVGVVLLAVAVYLAFRGRLTGAIVAGGVGVVLVTLAQVAPRLLKWPSDIWWRLALILGYVNSRILLGLVFYIVLTPVGLIRRLLGYDSLNLRRRTWEGWSTYPARYRQPNHYRRMY